VDVAEKLMDLEQRVNLLMQGLGAGAWVPYTPTWSGLTALGSGFSSDGRYWQLGKLVICEMNLTGGIGTSLGSATIQVTLPVQKGSGEAGFGVGRLAAGRPLLLRSAISGTVATVYGYLQGSPMSIDTPGNCAYTWVAGNQITATMMYECA